MNRSLCAIYIDDRLDSISLPEALDLLPPWRREKALAYRHDGPRRQSVAAWLLLRRACQEQLHLADVPRVELAEGGKPYFPDMPQLHFNLSHCTEAAACALANKPVGIDIERPRRANESLLRYVMNSQEQRRIQLSPNPELEFSTIWTQKEAPLKLSGRGLTLDLPPLLLDTGHIHFQTHVHSEGRYVYTLATYTSDDMELLNNYK
jgi:4'-phosphopantetheinyl transferase